MERHSDYASPCYRGDMSCLDSCSSGSSPGNEDPINNNSNNNAANFDKGNNGLDIKWLSSKIVHSDDVTRQNLNRKQSISNATPTADDDDEQFFHKLKSEIDKNRLSYSKEYHKSHMNYQNNALTVKKRKPILDAETQNVMKRFKRDSEQTNSIEPLSNATIVQSSTNNNILKQTRNTSTNIINKENIMQFKNLFSANISNSRIPSSKCIFQVTSKLQTNILPLATSEAAIVHEEYEESLFCGMILLTPPDSNSVENDDDS